MIPTKYVFVVKAPGYSSASHRTGLNSSQFVASIIGVADVEDALIAIDKLTNDLPDVVELCGGFSEDEARVIRERLNGAVPVGLVVYPD